MDNRSYRKKILLPWCLYFLTILFIRWIQHENKIRKRHNRIRINRNILQKIFLDDKYFLPAFQFVTTEHIEKPDVLPEICNDRNPLFMYSDRTWIFLIKQIQRNHFPVFLRCCRFGLNLFIRLFLRSAAAKIPF